MNEWGLVVSSAISGVALVACVWKVTAFCRWWVKEARDLLRCQHETFIQSRVKSHELMKQHIESMNELTQVLRGSPAFRAGTTLT